MGIKIETTTTTSVIFGNMTLCKDSIYIIQLKDAREEIGKYVGFEKGYVVFQTLLGKYNRQYQPKNIVKVEHLDNMK